MQKLLAEGKDGLFCLDTVKKKKTVVRGKNLLKKSLQRKEWKQKKEGRIL